MVRVRDVGLSVLLCVVSDQLIVARESIDWGNPKDVATYLHGALSLQDASCAELRVDLVMSQILKLENPG